MNSKRSIWTRRQIFVSEFGVEAWEKMSHAMRQKDGRDFYHSGAYFKNGYVVAKRCKGGAPQTYHRGTSLLQPLQQQ